MKKRQKNKNEGRYGRESTEPEIWFRRKTDKG